MQQRTYRALGGPLTGGKPFDLPQDTRVWIPTREREAAGAESICLESWSDALDSCFDYSRRGERITCDQLSANLKSPRFSCSHKDRIVGPPFSRNAHVRSVCGQNRPVLLPKPVGSTPHAHALRAPHNNVLLIRQTPFRLWGAPFDPGFSGVYAVHSGINLCPLYC